MLLRKKGGSHIYLSFLYVHTNVMMDMYAYEAGQLRQTERKVTIGRLYSGKWLYCRHSNLPVKVALSPCVNETRASYKVPQMFNRCQTAVDVTCREKLPPLIRGWWERERDIYKFMDDVMPRVDCSLIVVMALQSQNLFTCSWGDRFSARACCAGSKPLPSRKECGKPW